MAFQGYGSEVWVMGWEGAHKQKLFSWQCGLVRDSGPFPWNLGGLHDEEGYINPPTPTPHPDVLWVTGPQTENLIKHEESASQKELVGSQVGSLGVGGVSWFS